MLRLQRRALTEHPLRTVVPVAMVTVCAALVVAVAGLGQSVRSTADRLADQAAGTADVEVAAPYAGGTVPEDVVAAVAGAGAVAAAAPTVQAGVAVEGERALLLAGDQRALPFLPEDLAEAFTVGGRAGQATSAAPGRPLLSAPLAAALGVGAGDRLALQGTTGPREVVVGGVLPADATDGRVIVTDLATGQRLRGGPPGADRILVDLEAGVPGERARRELRRVLAGRAELVEPAQRAEDAAEALAPLVRPLAMLAGLTVTVAGVLVFNVVSVSVAERRRHLAIQRALGARRWRLWARLVAEAGLIGAVGGVAGAALGRVATARLVDQVPPALANAVLPTRIAADVPTWLLLAGVASGVAAAAAAAAVAAAPVLRLSPIEAMGPRDVVGEPAAAVRPLTVALGVAGLGAGTALVAAAPVTAQTVAALTMLGSIVVLVWAFRAPLARALAGAGRRAGPAGVLAALAIARSPARSAVTLLGALLPVAAVVTLGGVQVNVYDTAHRDYAALASTELFVSAEPLSEATGATLLPAGLAGDLAEIDGVESVRRLSFGFVRLGGAEAFIEGVDPGTTAPGSVVASPEARRRLHRSGAAIVTRPLADRLGVGPGDRLDLPTAAGTEPVQVADVVDLIAWPGGAVIADFDRLAAWSGVDTPGILEVETGGPDATRAVAAAARRWSERAGVDLAITSGAEAVDETLVSVRQSQALFSALQAVLMAAGAFAIVTTLVISTIGRTRELGLLRAVGARRRLVRRAVAVESFAVTLAGAALGVVVGVLFQYIGVRLMTRASGFPADFALSVRPSATALLAAVAIAAVAAAATARRVVALDVLDAVAYE